MRTETAKPVRLEDYRPPDWLIDTVDLDVKLHPTATQVRATLSLRPNPEGRGDAPLALDGEELSLVSLSLDNVPLTTEHYATTASGLTIAAPPRRPFRLTIETLVNPSANTQLMGLYRSGATYCTQCEAEGFRRITYFPDRPDVMAVFTTRIEADKAEAPVLLANGNLVESGDLPGGRHPRIGFLEGAIDPIDVVLVEDEGPVEASFRVAVHGALRGDPRRNGRSKSEALGRGSSASLECRARSAR